jgi:hypothetical protein
VAAVFEHVTVKTEPPESDLGLTTRFERNAIALTRNLAGAGDPIQAHHRRMSAQEAKVNR